MVHLRYLPILLVSLFLAGCGAGDAKKAGDATVARFFAAMAKKDWNEVNQCCSNQFFSKVSKEEHAKLLTKVTDKLGDYQSHQQVGFKYMTGTSTQLTMTYEVQYSKGKATEIFMFLGSPDENGYEISGHRIDSPALLNNSQ